MTEFDFIDRLRALTRLIPPQGADAYDLRDDTCLLADHHLKKNLFASTDMLCEGVHFFADDCPKMVIKKAIRTNISDIAAKGGRLYGMMLSLGIPKKHQSPCVFDKIYQGLQEDMLHYHLPLLGGDMTQNQNFVVNITIFGVTDYQIPLRSQAQVGDYLYLTGTLGRAAAGLQMRLGKILDYPSDDFLQAYLLPCPAYDTGLKLAPYMRASCDISDGFLQDLEHILSSSDVGASIWLDKIPVVQAFADREKNLHLSLTGGDDYQILCTSAYDGDILMQKAGLQKGEITQIGKIISEKGVFMNENITFQQKGFGHF